MVHTFVLMYQAAKVPPTKIDPVTFPECDVCVQF